MNMEGIIDFHTHILPGLDDGSKTPEESLAMLEALARQRVAGVALTPHFYTHKQSLASFLEQRQKAYECLRRQGGDSLVPVYLGAETYLTDYIFNYDDITPLCITGTRYLLTEMPFHSRFGASAMSRIQRLIGNYTVTPILAHIERYEPIMKDRNVAEELLDLGCIMQVNASSFAVKTRSEQKKLLRMVEKGYVHLLGTDCHNMDSRRPDMETGLTVIAKKLGCSYVNAFIENGNQILLGN